MLKKRFKHHAWFKEKEMTVKQFLDYVLSNHSDFAICEKRKLMGNDLLAEPVTEYFLTDGRYKMKLGYQERNYLASKSEYFKNRLPTVNPKYLEVVINANGEPLRYEKGLIEFSR